MSELLSLSQAQACTILEALRRGGVPIEHAELLAVGRSEWLSSVREDLGFIASGGSKPRFIVAPYGGGKTHFLSLVSSLSLELNYAVSYIELQSREAPFDRFETIFGKLMRELNTRDGGGVQQVLDRWASHFPYYTAQETDSALRSLARSLDFRNALRSYLELTTISSSASLASRQDIVAWLQGARLPQSDLKRLGIRNQLTILNVSDIMASFLDLLRAAGYSGLVLLLDEAEAITSLSQSRSREEANRNLRKLLDNTDGNRGLYLLFATTPRFIEDKERGAQSYPALWDRIRTPLAVSSTMTSRRSLIMRLEPLCVEHCITLAERVVDIHGVAWDWSADQLMTENDVRLYVERYAEARPGGPVRPFLRMLVDLLDVLQQHDGAIDLARLISELAFGEE